MPAASPDKLIDRLASGKPIGAIVLEGTDHYLRELCRNKIIETCVPEGARDWGVARMSARESGWDEILGRAQTLPMLAPRQVIVVEDAESFERLGEKSREAVLEALEEYLTSPAPLTVLLLEATALDGRQKFSKLLHEKALVVALTIGSESAASLAAQMAKDLGVEIDASAAALLADVLNGQPARIRIELEKLATYVKAGGRITSVDVELLVVAARKNTVWQLADMLASRRRGAALAFLDNLLREGEEPVRIVGAVARMYRQLIEARALPANSSGFQAAGVLHMPPQAAEAALRNAHRIPKNELLAGLVALAEADSQLKSSNPDHRATMEFLVAKLTSSAAITASRTA
jgi:DNA polymerase III subunit delta